MGLDSDPYSQNQRTRTHLSKSLQNDTDVKTLASMVSLLEKDLRSYRSNITRTKMPLYAEIGIPFYFHNNYTPQSSEPGEDTWNLATGDARWANVLRNKFSVAVYRVGFQRAPTDASDIDINGEMSASNARVVPPPYMTIFGVDPSSCAFLGRPKGCNETEFPPVTVLNVDFSHSSLSLFADPRGGPELPWIPWNTWPELGGDALSKISDTFVFLEEAGCESARSTFRRESKR